jgi:hypothetical protein
MLLHHQKSKIDFKFISFTVQPGCSVLYFKFPDIPGIKIMLATEVRNRFVERARLIWELNKAIKLLLHESRFGHGDH